MLASSPVSAYAPVSDIARGRAFYEGALRLEPLSIEDAGVVYECGNGTQFFMYLSDGAGTSRASYFFWTVDDIDAEVADLKSRGVAFQDYGSGEIVSDTGNKAAWFTDPDSNILALIQPL